VILVVDSDVGFWESGFVDSCTFHDLASFLCERLVLDESCMKPS